MWDIRMTTWIKRHNRKQVERPICQVNSLNLTIRLNNSTHSSWNRPQQSMRSKRQRHLKCPRRSHPPWSIKQHQATCRHRIARAKPAVVCMTKSRREVLMTSWWMAHDCKKTTRCPRLPPRTCKTFTINHNCLHKAFRLNPIRTWHANSRVRINPARFCTNRIESLLKSIWDTHPSRHRIRDRRRPLLVVRQAVRTMCTWQTVPHWQTAIRLLLPQQVVLLPF